MTLPLDVLFEDNHLLAINKPADLITMGAPVGKPSLLALAKDYIKRKYHKPGEAYLGAMSRLDYPVSGVILFARTSKAAARLTDQFRRHAVEKVYWAIVEGALPRPEGECVDHLHKDERHRLVKVCRPSTPGAREARLTYRRLGSLSVGWLLEVRLQTGRKHQIRVQMAERGHPILGDLKYGGRRRMKQGIGLHARRLVFEHPVRREPIELVAPTNDAWRQLGVSGVEADDLPPE